MKIIPVVLSGGRGARLWPLSRNQYPKQYMLVEDKQTMLQATIHRLQGIKDMAAPVVICNQEHRFIVAEQLKQIGIEDATIILEPEGKNTAPAIAAAAHYIKSGLLLLLPADHIIQEVQVFHEVIKKAVRQAMQGRLVMFGITPIEPNVGYGYIEKSSEIDDHVFKIDNFFEKPDVKKAKEFLKSGNFLWNSGMFLFTAQEYIKELNKYNEKISVSCKRAVDKSRQDNDFLRLDSVEFSNSPAGSIDCVVMEKTKKSVVMPINIGWNDVGSWEALHQIGEKDNNNNVVKGNVVTLDTVNSYINAENHMVATIGIDNLVIVDTADVTLVANKDKSQQVKQMVEQLHQENRVEEQLHRKVYRPWGWYDIIDSGNRFKVKRLSVKPGAALSLQKHYHRAEHWIVVNGTAKITIGELHKLLNNNQSTYIPIGVPHRLENPGKLPLEMIEVQSGNYLEEDDIERLEDHYGRE